MLKRLFTSKTRIKLLETFLLNPDGEFFIRELTRRLSEQINSIRRELANLKSLGLLKSRFRNRKKFYLVNKNFILFNELKSILLKASNTLDVIAKKLQKIGKMDFLLLSGQFINKTSPTDIFIVGEVDKKELEDLITRELEPKHPIKMSVIPREDFLYRLKINDKFVKDLISDSENLVVVNRLEKYLADKV